jgi:molybdopterin converting factor small subunit
MHAQLCDDQGAIRKFVNLYVNDEDIRFLDGTQTAVKDGDELAIIPAVAGGSGGD